MNAHAHLLSLGWAGPGHSLDSEPYKQKGHRGRAYDPAKVGNNGNGLVKPISISQRQGRFGIGKKAHEPQAGNEWWLKGFESALGNIGKSESERSSGTSTPIIRDNAGKHGGLYGFFIKGQQMKGTIDEVKEVKGASKKRKSDALDDTIEDHTAMSIATSNKVSSKTSAADFEQAGAFFALRDKDEKRTRQVERPRPTEEFKQVSEYLEVQNDRAKRNHSKSETVDSGDGELNDTDQPHEARYNGVESKEERLKRRQRRRKGKEQKRNTLAALEFQQPPNSSSGVDTADAAAKFARKAERKRRKVATTGTIF